MKLKKLFEPVLVSVVITAMAIANIWHIVVQYLHRPTGTVFVGITHYYEDYFYYLSQLTQSAMGGWLTRNLYTTEAIPGTMLWWPNLLLGKIVAILGLTPWTVYDIAVFSVSVLSMLLLYITAKKLYPENQALRIATFLIAILTTCYYLLERNTDGSIRINPFQYFYNYTESLNRLGGVVHLILQNIFSLLVILNGADLLNSIFIIKSAKSFVRSTLLLIVTAFLLMSINPIYMAVDIAAIVSVSIGFIIFKPDLKTLGKLVITAVLCGISLSIPLIVTLRTFSIPFYQYFRWWENQIWPTNQYIFFHSMGPIVLLIPLGIIPFFFRITFRPFNIRAAEVIPLRVLGVVWAVIPIVIYFTKIPQLLQFPYFRLHQPPSYIMLAAVAAQGLMLPGLLLSKVIKRPVAVPIFTVFLAVYLAFQLPMIRQEIVNRTTNYALASWMNHIPKDIYDGLLFLKKQPHTKVALAFNNLELLIPVISGFTVYEGHHSLTYDYASKIADVAIFYTKRMTGDEAKKFLTANNIGYILWMKKDGPDTLGETYPSLTKIFENTGIVIYSYNPI